MPQFVVLLRGVNVGGAKRVPMADFRELLEGEGYTEVATLLNSGNAVFRSSRRLATAHAAAIGERLRERIGVDVPVVVKPSSEFLAAVARCPFVPPDEHQSRFLVVFGQDEAALRGLSALQALVEAPERLHLGSAAGYLYCVRGILESKAGSALLGKLGRQVTTRNWATVLKLERLLHEGTRPRTGSPT